MKSILLLSCTFLSFGMACENQNIPPDSEAVIRQQLTISDPSGLFWSDSEQKLFVVSDNTGHVYELNEDFEVVDKIKTDVADAEGMCIMDGNIVIANEALNTLDWYDTDGDPIFRLAPAYPESISSKNGIEGLCYRKETNAFHFVIEKKPRLMGTFKWATMQFEFKEIDFAEDFSGIEWDQKREAFWIVSDQSKKAFLYKENAGVLHTISLPEKGAEGVAYDVKKDRLFICYDDSETLEVYDLSKID